MLVRALLDSRALVDARYLSLWPLEPVGEKWWWARSVVSAAEQAKRNGAERAIALLECMRGHFSARFRSDDEGTGLDSGTGGLSPAASASGGVAADPHSQALDSPPSSAESAAADKAMYALVVCVARVGQLEALRREAIRLEGQARRRLLEERVAADARAGRLRRTLGATDDSATPAAASRRRNSSLGWRDSTNVRSSLLPETASG